MRACLLCGQPLPRRKERGHREREYCSDSCRQRASRARNQAKRDLARLWQQTQEHLANNSGIEIRPEERLQFQIMLDLAEQQQAILERENTMLRTQLDLLELQNEMLQTQITLLKETIIDQTEELAQARYLLDHPSRQR